MDLDAVGKLEQSLEAAVELPGTFGRLDGEVRPSRIADEEAVTRQRQPRLVAPLPVEDRERAVFGPVPRRVDDPDTDRADRDLVAVGQRVERIPGLGQGVNRDREPVVERQPSVPGYVVGVRVRFEHADQAYALVLRRCEILLDGKGRVDHERLAGGLVADQVRGAAKIVVDELAEQHGKSLTTAAYDP